MTGGVLTSSPTQFNLRQFLLSNVLLVLALALLILPTTWDLAHHLWQTPEQGHGPIVLAMLLWLFWSQREAFAALPTQPQPSLGLLLCLVSLPFYVLGRSQSILLFEVGSFIPLMAGVLLFTRGPRAIRLYWFALLFMVFLVPLPGAVVDAVTGALKSQISAIAEELLYAVGYPIARSGVMLVIGPYQLLVADACSGLHSMFSLLAVGSLYTYMTNHSSHLRNVLLILAILPMAFLANVVRVIVLILVTYHFGDAAGQGFVHDFAGLVLFSVALIGMFALDKVLGFVLPDRKPA